MTDSHIIDNSILLQISLRRFAVWGWTLQLRPHCLLRLRLPGPPPSNDGRRLEPVYMHQYVCGGVAPSLYAVFWPKPCERLALLGRFEQLKFELLAAALQGSASAYEAWQPPAPAEPAARRRRSPRGAHASTPPSVASAASRLEVLCVIFVSTLHAHSHQTRAQVFATYTYLSCARA